MATLKLRAVGYAVGVVLPKELPARLDLRKGDTAHGVEAPEGLDLTTLDPEAPEQLELGREPIRRCRETLRNLAT